MEVGLRLKTIRLAKGMSQKDVASLAKVSVMSISNLERGITRAPSAENLLPIALALDVAPQWLLTGKGIQHLGDAVIPMSRFAQHQLAAVAPVFSASVEDIRLITRTLAINQQPLDQDSHAEVSQRLDQLVAQHANTTLSAEERALVGKFRQMDETQKKAAQTIADALAQSNLKQHPGG